MEVRKFMIAAVLTLAFVAAPVSLVATSALAAPATGNTIAICGCGSVFTPNEKTKHITFEGVQYACCSEGCHEMASKMPEKAAKSANAKFEQTLTKATMPVNVANVIEITKDGAMALCGCGHKSALTSKASYFKADDKTYAACGKGCLDKMSEDVKKAAAMIETKLAEHHHGGAH